MEKAVGIVCEYNPLHAGHIGQLAAVRERFPNKPIVLVMSGNFVQRASAAVCDHYARARAAVECGADLVLLLPFPYSTYGAAGYAASALSILERTGAVDTLCFGAEEKDGAFLKECAKTLLSPEFEARLKENLQKEPRAAFAHQRAQTLEEFLPGAAEVLRQPNNILSVEYLCAIEEQGYALTPVILPRAPHPSATALREELREGLLPDAEDLGTDVLLPYLYKGELLPQQKLGAVLLSALRAGLSCPELDILGARVAQSARKARDFEEFVSLAKTRKVPSARIRRGVLHAYFGVEEGKDLPPYTVLLAANEKGREVLSFIYNIGTVPVFTKPSAPLKAEPHVSEAARLHARADSVYAGLCGRAGDWFLKQNPEIVNKL